MVVWQVNSTLHGGGVAEILDALIRVSGSTSFQPKRFVTNSDSFVFQMTKRLHHRVHGHDRGGLPTAEEHGAYMRFAAANAERLLAVAEQDDLIVLHDPQTVPMVPLLRQAGYRVAWRCHIGTATANETSRSTWAYLSQFWTEDVVLVFSDPALVPAEAAGHDVRIIQPSIDPDSGKNRGLDDAEADEILATAGLHGGPFIVQVSRWDPLKDMPGVLSAFAGQGLADLAQLVLCGPSPDSIADDPEAAAVFAEVAHLRESLPAAVRERVHLVCTTLSDPAANDRLVNALQRRAAVVVQKSLQEGFGLTVTEAMWKARPVVATGVGGILRQITHGQHGLLLDDPADHRKFAGLVRRVLENPDLATTLGTAAARRVAERFTVHREAADHEQLYQSLEVTHA